jgi:hypothetical protein
VVASYLRQPGVVVMNERKDTTTRAERRDHNPPAGCGVSTLPSIHPLPALALSKISRIPCRRDWRFRRADINAWVVAEEIKASSEEDKVGDVKRAQQQARKKLGRPPKS